MKFKAGDQVILTTDKGKSWLIKLQLGENFSCHLGSISHDNIIGKCPGDSWTTPKGTKIFFFYPTLNDFLFKLTRRTQIVYPKDIGAMLCYGDIRSGMTVLESGVGSGALTMFLLNAVGTSGMLVSVETRKEFVELALNNVKKFFDPIPKQWNLVVGNIENIAFNYCFDRVVLDLPEPWKAVPNVSKIIKPGGIIVSLSPQITQLQWTARELKKHGFRFLQIFEILKRDWHIDDRRSRPADRMIAHTGFLLFGRKVNLPSD